MTGHLTPWWDVSLTSGATIGFLVLAAIGATVATALTWDMDRWKRTRRSLMLLLTQVLAMLSLGAGLNAAGGFYGDLSDLFGGTHPSGPVIQAGGGAPAATGVPAWLAAARRSSGAGRGVWARMTITGRHTRYSLPAWVYVPDAYFDPGQPTRRFPVVMMLAGFPGRVENWDRQGDIVPVLDRLMADGSIPPMILISVSQNRDATHDSECVNAPHGFQAETYLTGDATAAIAATFRVLPARADWALMGYSTGGYCAADLALRHPRQFGQVISFDEYFAPAVDATTGDLFHHDTVLQRAYTPTDTIRDRRPVPLRFYLMSGDAEAASKAASTAFARSVRAPDQATVVTVAGGHNWGTWRAALPGALRWLRAGLPPAPPSN